MKSRIKCGDSLHPQHFGVADEVLFEVGIDGALRPQPGEGFFGFAAQVNLFGQIGGRCFSRLAIANANFDERGAGTGGDPFWLMDNSLDGGAMRAVEFEIVGGPEKGDKGGQYFKSQWLNALGGGMKTPAAADRRSVLAKYGSKFAALAGKPAVAGNAGGDAYPTTTAGREARATALPPVPNVPRSTGGTHCATNAGGDGRATTPVATMEEAWAALNEANPGKEPGVLEKLWFDTIARSFPNKSNSDLKPHEWGKLKAEFHDEIPM